MIAMRVRRMRFGIGMNTDHMLEEVDHPAALIGLGDISRPRARSAAQSLQAHLSR